MSAWSVKQITERAQHAEQSRRKIERSVDECYAYYMPWRRRNAQAGGFDRLFDMTGPVNAGKFAGRVQRDATPPFQRWFAVEGGPLVPDEQRSEVNRELGLATEIAHAVLDASAFGQASKTSYGDLGIGTLALLANEGTDRQPIHWIAAPPWSLGIEEGADGRICNVYYERQYPAWKLPKMWPAAAWPASLGAKIAKGDTTLVRVLQASYYDEDLDGWYVSVIVREGGDHEALRTEQRTNPWIISRWWNTPEDPWGRGVFQLALPHVKTSNKAVEMILRAAAFSLAPPLMVLHDGVVNPDTMRIAPNALIRVGRTGGPMGRSLEPLDIGQRMDMGQIVLGDTRQEINRATLNQELPPPTGGVRSASEMMERAKALSYDAGSAFGGFNHEFAPQVVARTFDLLDRRKVAGVDWKTLKIDQLLLRVRLVSPLARMQSVEDLQSIVQAAELLKAIGGDELVHLGMRLTEDIDRVLALGGVPAWIIRSSGERKAMIDAAAKTAAAAAAPAPAADEVMPAAATPAGAAGRPALSLVA